MTLHLLLPVRTSPAFFHLTRHGEDLVGCHTPRGAGQCTCGQYRLCDPLHHQCSEACDCVCHGLHEE